MLDPAALTVGVQRVSVVLPVLDDLAGMPRHVTPALAPHPVVLTENGHHLVVVDILPPGVVAQALEAIVNQRLGDLDRRIKMATCWPGRLQQPQQATDTNISIYLTIFLLKSLPVSSSGRTSVAVCATVCKPKSSRFQQSGP